MVDLKSKFLDISLLIRRDTHLIASVGSRTKNGKGVVLSESHRQFTYVNVGKPVPKDAFEIGGSKTLPLEQLGK